MNEENARRANECSKQGSMNEIFSLWKCLPPKSDANPHSPMEDSVRFFRYILSLISYWPLYEKYPSCLDLWHTKFPRVAKQKNNIVPPIVWKESYHENGRQLIIMPSNEIIEIMSEKLDVNFRRTRRWLMFLVRYLRFSFMKKSMFSIGLI